jgi:DNA-binding winged helix-turn-helix (wHTH) protein/tetratricopeptide (TPR) repeat protein
MSETFQLGDWDVNTASNSLNRKGVSVHLEPKMMDVLAYLSAHAGQVISTEQLLIEFWRGTFYGDAPVQKCIAMLRKKLGDNSRQPVYIETVQRRGYRIIAPVVHLDGRQRWNNINQLESWTHGSPYLGLQTFQPQHAAIFFGRNKAIAEVVHQLNQALDDAYPLLLLMGKSGSGKSSLLRAGVIPFLTRAEGLAGIKIDQYKVITPTRGQATSIFRQLIGAMDEMGLLVQTWDLDSYANELSQHPARLKSILKDTCLSSSDAAEDTKAKSQVARPQRLIVIDQFEQILQDATLSGEDLACLIAFLNELVKTQSLILIVSMRNDFYANSMEIKGFSALKDEGQQYDLQPPNATDIARMIRLPAIAAGLSFEENLHSGEKLDEVLLEAAIGHPDALPLLEFTLDLLYQRQNEDNTLLFSAYTDIGGLEGAIARQAEITYQSLGCEIQASWQSVMHELVTINNINQTVLTGRKVPLSHFSSPDDLNFIQQFVDARLFVTESGIAIGEQGNGKRVSVVHEALLKHWQRIIDWAEDNRIAMLKRTQLATDCNRWLSEGKPQDMLLPAGKKVEDAKWLGEQSYLHLSDDEQQFIRLSQHRQRKGQRYKKSAISALILLALTTTGLALYANNQTQVALKQTTKATLLRDKAEDLVDYMLGDLRGQLEPIGKLDVLEGVGHKTLDYYAGIETGGKLRQARSLKLIAEINVNRGEFEQAKEQLARGLGLIADHQTEMGNSEHLLYLAGHMHYWLGVISYVKQDYPAAMTQWLEYLSFSQQLLAGNENNLEWMLEVSSAQHNIGGLALRINDYVRAKDSFTSSINIKRKILLLDPTLPEANTSLRRSLLGLADVEFFAYHFVNAEALVAEAYVIAKTLLQENPSDYNAKYQALSSANLLIRNQLALGQGDKARYAIEEGIALAEQLAEQEPQNEAWMTTVATLLFYYWDFKLLFAKDIGHIDLKLIELTQASYEKSQDVPLKQRLFSSKLVYEQYLAKGEFLTIGLPDTDFNIAATPRLAAELHLKCLINRCREEEVKTLAMLQTMMMKPQEGHQDVNAILAEFYLALISGNLRLSSDILLTLESKGYVHPYLRDIYKRYKNHLSPQENR